MYTYVGKLDKTGYHFCFYFSTENMLKKITNFFLTPTFIEARKKYIFFTNFSDYKIIKNNIYQTLTHPILANQCWIKQDMGYIV